MRDVVPDWPPSFELLVGDCLFQLPRLPNNHFDSLVTDPPAGIAFMNQEWDEDKGGRDPWVAWMTQVMTEAKRTLKPGAHALVWAIPRTSHWTAWALENAGFEIRDVITHHFGSGFPKNMDISKAIDKKLGAERPVVAQRAQAGAKFKIAAETIDNGGFNDPNRESFDITAPATDEAKQWDGWGTALKPGSEHWILVRKPGLKTVVDTVLKHGTGAINIDACRLEDGTGIPEPVKKPNFKNTVYGNGLGGADWSNEKGRWPANVILTHSAACGAYCMEDCPTRAFGDEARFFKRFKYAPKPSVTEKNTGLEEIEPQKVNDGRKTEIDNAFQRGETTRQNIHPTVKSVELMDYLIRLITPPGGTVLDCFMGSGSTGVAAVTGGWDFVGIEKHLPYFEIAQGRIRATETGQQNLFNIGRERSG